MTLSSSSSIVWRWSEPPAAEEAKLLRLVPLPGCDFVADLTRIAPCPLNRSGVFLRRGAEPDRTFVRQSLVAEPSSCCGVEGGITGDWAAIILDEFDRGARNIFNYGHSFGHAIEAATNFGIPHGIGVTIGMDMANYVAAESGVGNIETFASRHDCLKRNYRTFESYPVPVDPFLRALGKDKKNVGTDLVLILPDADGNIQKTRRANDDAFRLLCTTFLEQVRLS